MYDWPDRWLTNELTKTLNLPEDASHQLLNWARTARERTPVAFIGAGMSFNAIPKARYRELGFRGTGTPRAFSWKELSEKLRSELKYYGEDGESDALWLAELYEQAFGTEALIRIIRDAVPDDFLSPGEAHEEIHKIRWQAILTTNYDTLIERAWKATHAPGKIQTCVTDADLVRSSGQQMALEVIHLHGILSRPETIILTLEQYRRYPERSPGLLAKVRQLFIQHPMLLVGFSATDPNFIQWNGWISDLLGTHRNPCISLSVGAIPGAARRSYWNGALTFIQIAPNQLAGILRALGKYLRDDFGRDDTVPVALERINSASSIENLTKTLPSILAIQATSIIHTGDARKREIFTAAVKQALVLRHGEAHADKIWSQLNPSRKAAEAPQARPTGDAQKILRETLGVDWASWLIQAITHLGLQFRIGRTLFRAINEEQQLPQDCAPGTRRSLRLSILEQEVSRGGSGSELLAAALRDDINLAPEERHRLNSLVQVRNLRRGLPITIDNNSQGAQSLRRFGFVASLEGRVDEALAAFSRAAFLSRDEGEAPLFEWLTINSALQIEERQKGSQSSKPSATEFDQLKARSNWLESQIDSIGQFRTLEARARDELISRLAARADASSDELTAPQSSTMLLSILERTWTSPWLTMAAAELYGQAQWAAGNHTEGALALARYGSRRLKGLLTEHHNTPHRNPIAPELIAILTLNGRWPSEWIARAEALTQITSELDNTALESLWTWIQDALRSSSQGPIIRTGTDASPSELIDSLSLLALARWSHLKPSHFISELETLRETKDHQTQQVVKNIAKWANILPVQIWIESGNFSDADLDSLLSFVLTELKSSRKELEDMMLPLTFLLELRREFSAKPPSLKKSTAIMADILGRDSSTDSLFDLHVKVTWLSLPGAIKPEALRAHAIRALTILSKPESDWETTDALYAIGNTFDLFDLQERKFILSKLSDSLSAMDSADPEDAVRMVRADAVALVGRRFIETATPDSVEEVEKIIIRILDTSFYAMPQIAQTRSNLSPHIKQLLSRKISDAMTNPSVSDDGTIRGWAFEAAKAYLAHQQSETMPVEWIYFSRLLARGGNAAIAHESIGLLAQSILRKPSASTLTEIEQCISALLDASLSPRAQLVGQAAFWLLKIKNSSQLSSEQNQLLGLTIIRLETDNRAGVRSKIWLAKNGNSTQADNLQLF
ncbi:hypothetical protein D7X74_31830 [Corallococcus sp. CA047B]|uniref:SIR2 family protein n=1 Tax=Corallococcus sp. CA047B TaxID=2316729 RepID=UPI000EA2D00A|nr:SIR2 family protein [Corallococcus sp. CA047B]RKH08339.1 hypothetical protein D7X74_31830 [Corallococcus sp. CA047B]